MSKEKIDNAYVTISDLRDIMKDFSSTVQKTIDASLQNVQGVGVSDAVKRQITQQLEEVGMGEQFKSHASGNAQAWMLQLKRLVANELGLDRKLDDVYLERLARSNEAAQESVNRERDAWAMTKAKFWDSIIDSNDYRSGMKIEDLNQERIAFENVVNDTDLESAFDRILIDHFGDNIIEEK